MPVTHVLLGERLKSTSGGRVCPFLACPHKGMLYGDASPFWSICSLPTTFNSTLGPLSGLTRPGMSILYWQRPMQALPCC